MCKKTNIRLSAAKRRTTLTKAAGMRTALSDCTGALPLYTYPHNLPDGRVKRTTESLVDRRQSLLGLVIQTRMTVTDEMH
jgi:hypothetical protein